jgi:hypothetical protein
MHFSRSHDIPLLCVVDTDKQTVRSVVDYYFEGGQSYLFAEQVIIFTTQGREHCHGLIIEAIKRAVQTIAKSAEPAPPPEIDRIHEVDEESGTPENAAGPDALTELKAALLSKFGSAKAAFSSFSKDGQISKREWRKVIRKMMSTLSNEDSKTLRKQLPKRVNGVQFSELLGEAKVEYTKQSESPSEASGLAALPAECPRLPSSFKSRPHPQEQLVLALLASGGNHSTSVSSPKSRISRSIYNIDSMIMIMSLYVNAARAWEVWARQCLLLQL